MPYSYPDKIPKVAQNWTAEEQRKCTEAAQAVLEEGGSEEDAIFACIHNAGKGKDDDMDKELDYKGLPGFETKSLPSFIKGLIEDQGIVEHYIAIMGNVDEGNDRILPGAFTKTIAERGHRIRVLDNHRMDSLDRIVGKPAALREVPRHELPPELLAKFPEATAGLLATTQYALDTKRGAEVFKLIKGGFAPESSIGYDAIKPRDVKEVINGEEKIIRELPEIRLWEYSNVIFGMNPATRVVSAKGKDSTDAETDTSTEDPPEDSPSIVNFNIVIPEGMKGMNADEFIALVTKAFEQAGLTEPAADADTEPTTEAKAEPDTPEAGPSPETPTSDDVAPLTLDVDRIKSVIDIELEMIDLMLLDI